MAETTLKTHVLIVGGGIVGAGLFRDLSLHEIPSILIEKKSFCSQTSSKSSKMLHGGIRYLENYDFKLVKEALHEKNLWLALAPEYAKIKKFLIPTFEDSLHPLWLLKIGVKLYDLLSYFQNKPSGSYSPKDTMQHLPGLKKYSLKGSVYYYDSIVNDRELGIANIKDALTFKNSLAFENTEIIEIVENKNEKKVLIKDLNSNKNIFVYCNEIIFATGPFTDRLMHKLSLPWEDKLLLSKGSHIIIPHQSLPKLNDALLIQTKEGRVIFVIPDHENILVGTTEVDLSKDSELFDLEISPEEESYLLESLNGYFPEVNITKEHILKSFAGVRPLVKEFGTKNSSKTSREHLLYHISPTIHVLIGGKLTTFRTMGQELSKLIVTRLGKKYDGNKTKMPFLKPVT